MRINLGCGPDIKEGWTNVDEAFYLFNNEYYGKVEGWNIKFPPPDFYCGKYDFALLNHVLCTMKPDDAKKTLDHAYMCLKDGGKLQVIDMDLNKAFETYINDKPEDFPIEQGNIDYKLCMHISGFGTRLSLYTVQHLHDLLMEVGFKSAKMLLESEYDTRPKESLILEATK